MNANNLKEELQRFVDAEVKALRERSEQVITHLQSQVATYLSASENISDLLQRAVWLHTHDFKNTEQRGPYVCLYNFGDNIVNINGPASGFEVNRKFRLIMLVVPQGE